VTATEINPTPETEPVSPRLADFQREVDQLKVTGGKANPERTWTILSGIGLVVGIALGLFGWLGTRGAEGTLGIADYNSMQNFGLIITIASAAVFTVMSLRRYFRYWLVRLIFEQRDQTDRLLDR
jgi:hypothetical protein